MPCDLGFAVTVTGENDLPASRHRLCLCRGGWTFHRQGGRAPAVIGSGAVSAAGLGPAPLRRAGQAAGGEPGGEPKPAPSSARRHLPWAQLLRRVLSVEALSCPRCSHRERTVPMVVLAFLSGPEVGGRILKHLGLPVFAPALAAARPSGRLLGFGLAEEGAGVQTGSDDGGGETGDLAMPVRPPP
jgi:hypothetical protein